MEVKDIIKKRREELSLTYEQLGNMVGVGKSTVRKWETGLIENMRRDNIVALSKALNISPAIIMGWQPIEDDNKLVLSQEETTLLENYNKSNDEGKKMILSYSDYVSKNHKDDAIDEVTATKKDDEFTKILEARKKAEEQFKGKEHLMPIASHDRDGEFTDEEYNHDDDLMDDEDFWK